jgi:hypothetical protein
LYAEFSGTVTTITTSTISGACTATDHVLLFSELLQKQDKLEAKHNPLMENDIAVLTEMDMLG